MLRKRIISNQKDQYSNHSMTPDATNEYSFQYDTPRRKHKLNSFFNLPGLLVVFDSKSSESDSVQSPTSPFDIGLFSNFSNPFSYPRSENKGFKKSWDCGKVGLSIVDSLDDDDDDDDEANGSRKVVQSSAGIIVRSLHISNASVLFNTSTKPANVGTSNSEVLFEIGEPELSENFEPCSLDSWYRSKLTKSGTGFIGSIPFSVSEIELSEYYTCVTTHGSNPKVTHYLGDFIFELTDLRKRTEDETATPVVARLSENVDYGSPNDFLKFCYSCQKKLDGEDIYMYRGEKPFCSYTCRSKAIEVYEDTSNSCDEFYEASLFSTT